MGKPAILAIKIITDAAQASKGLKKSGDELGKFGKANAIAAGVAAGVLGAAVKFGKDAADAAGAAAKANRTLAHVMGDAAGQQSAATKAAIDYADALANQTGISRETIKSTQTMLAAYTELNPKLVGNSLAFDRATAAAQDLAAAGFGSAEGNAKMLGKALQDPIKYTASLARVGVVFTDAEKEKIKVMQKSGDIAGAQTVILGKLENAVGGTAKAQASSSAKMKAAWAGVQEQLGAALLPLMKTYNGLLLSAAQFASDNTGAIQLAVVAIAGLAAVILAVNIGLKVYNAALIVGKVAVSAWNLATKLAAAAQWLWNAAMAANPIGLIIVGVVALVAGLVILYKKCAWFRNIVNATFAGMLTAVQAVWRFLSVTLAPVWAVLGKAVSVVGQAAATAFGIWLAVMKAPLNMILLMVDAVKKLVDWIGKIKMPDVGGLLKKLNPFAASVTYGLSPTVTTSSPGAGRTAATSATSSSGGRTYNVNIYGAVDPQGTARSVQRMLHRADVRGGRARFA